MTRQLRPMATGELAYYDGSAGFLVDTNVWIDCLDMRSRWHDWAVDQIQSCCEQAPLHINLIVHTELLVPQTTASNLDALLDAVDVHRSTMPWGGAALAAAAFRSYRGRGGLKHKPLPDLYIGAHAAVANLTVLTCDARGYRSAFPRLRLVAPAMA